MADEAKLPSSSLGELEKIIKGYGHFGKEVDLDTLSKLIGINRTTISPNNPFLTEVGIITSGKRKQITDLGKRLARSLDLSQHEQAASAWQEVAKGSEFLSNLVSTVRIKGIISVEDAVTHTLFASGQKNTKANRTGARTVIDILLASRLLQSKDDSLKVATPPEPTTQREVVDIPDKNTELGEDDSHDSDLSLTSLPKRSFTPMAPSIAINIQLHLPETDNPSVYEELFKALRRHLLSPKDGE
jgi:hypothetical protein